MNREIEEMACAMCGQDKICGGVGVEKCIIYPDYRRQASRLYNAGYRKSTDVERLREELELAERCIYAIEDALYRGADNDYANEAIEEWETAIVALKQKYESEEQNRQ